MTRRLVRAATIARAATVVSAGVVLAIILVYADGPAWCDATPRERELQVHTCAQVRR